MAHAITSSDSMFSVREVPWHGLGVVLDAPPQSTAEAIEASGLSWRVEKEPIAVDRGNTSAAAWDQPRVEPIAGYYATVRQDTRDVVGVVGERYTVVQNRDAFRFVDELLGSSLHFETAGSLDGGRRVWVLATLPENIEVGGDQVRPYVLLMNSHDGSTALVAATTPVRVVCQNTLNWGLARATQRFAIRHTSGAREQVAQARKALQLSTGYYDEFRRLGNELALTPFSEQQLRRVLDELYPSGTSDTGRRGRRGREEVKERITSLFLTGITQGNAPRSKWAAVNAIVEHADWLRPLRDEKQRFARTIDNTAEKSRTLAAVLAV